MVVRDPKPYLDLVNEINLARNSNSNLLVVSLPGLGLNSYLKKYQEKNTGVMTVSPERTELGTYNLIVVSKTWNDNAFQVIDSVLRQAQPNQKFCVGITRPWIIYSSEYSDSYLSKHIYKTVWLRSYNFIDTVNTAKTYNHLLSNSELNKIYSLSGGIPQLIKFLAINSDLLKHDVNNIITDHNLKIILSPIADAIQKSSPDVLEKMGITNKAGEVAGSLICSFKTIAPKTSPIIEVDFDLSLKENGVSFGKKLTKSEAQILEVMLKNSCQINKEDISDIKWGPGKYDQFSDQAIHKTISRLAGKLKTYKIITVPKVGFILK